VLLNFVTTGLPFIIGTSTYADVFTLQTYPIQQSRYWSKVLSFCLNHNTW